MSLKFNILGKIYHIKKNFFPNLNHLKEFYNENRQEYILDINPMIFEIILEYYSTQKLSQPINIHQNYWKEILEKFHIDTSLLDINQRYERFVPRQKNLQLIHILFEYPDSCRFAQILHYICSMIALLSCLLISLSLTFRDSNIDVYIGNRTERILPTRIITHFQSRLSSIFIIDFFCLVWTIGEIILRILSTPSIYQYLTTLGLFDIIGGFFHFIYIYIIATETKPRQCQINPVHFNCITFNRRLMMLNLLRKIRLVRYIRPLKYFILSLLKSKREITRLIILISFLLAFFAPLIFIIESSYIYQYLHSTQISLTRCIRTISDACYYLILIITTVGFGDIYPISPIVHLISMFVSLLSLMMVSIPLSSIYNKYISVREIYQIQLTMPENIRYLVYNNDDVTEQINRRLKEKFDQSN